MADGTLGRLRDRARFAAVSRGDGRIAGLAHRSGSYHVVMQVTADLLDWQQDVRAGRPSCLLSEAAADAESPASAAA